MTTATGRRESTRWTRRAWFAVGFIPIGFVLSMLIGEGLFATLGYDSEDTDVPLGAIALAGGSALLVFLIPCLAAWLLGQRAIGEGESAGQVPAIVGGVVGALFLVTNLLGLAGRL